MSDIEIGDVVVLKSGSRKMTVESVENDQIKCCWWNEHCNQKSSDTFHVEAISADLQTFQPLI